MRELGAMPSRGPLEAGEAGSQKRQPGPPTRRQHGETLRAAGPLKEAELRGLSPRPGLSPVPSPSH